MKRKEYHQCIQENKLLELGIVDSGMAKELLVLAELREVFWSSISEKAKSFPFILKGIRYRT